VRTESRRNITVGERSRYQTDPVPDEVADNREGAHGRISDHTMAAVRKPLEAHKMRGQCRNQVLLTFYRDHRILFTAEDERRTRDVQQRREEVEGATFSARAREPMVGIGPTDRALHRLRIPWRPRVDGEGQTYPGLEFFRVQLSFDEAAARERPDLWPAQTFEQRDASLQM
jgi:hypothetical protein